MIKNMVEDHGSGGISVGVNEELVEMLSFGGWFEQGEGLQGFVPKRLKMDTYTNAPRGTSPLGLTLTKTPSFAELIETKLSKHGEQKIGKNKAQSPSDKLKASNIPALSLQIGSWKRVALYDGDLVAKCYFAKQKLVWEVLCEGLKSKMEIQWFQISAIRATFVEGRTDSLEIELQKPPTYFCESSPQPRKHTMWVAGKDFTGGQAQINKRHILQFAEGTLDKHYEKLLQCDSRLHELSRRPFLNISSPFFDTVPVDQRSNLFCQQSGILLQPRQLTHRIPLVGYSRSTSTPSQHLTPYRSISPSVNSVNSIYSHPLSSTAMNFRPVNKELSITTAMDLMRSHSARNFHPLNVHDIPVWNQGVVQNTNESETRQTFEINSIAHDLLSEPESPVYADEKSLLVKVSSFGSALCELNAGTQVASTSDDEGYYNVVDQDAFTTTEAYSQINNLSYPSSSSMFRTK